MYSSVCNVGDWWLFGTPAYACSIWCWSLHWFVKAWISSHSGTDDEHTLCLAPSAVRLVLSLHLSVAGYRLIALCTEEVYGSTVCGRVVLLIKSANSKYSHSMILVGAGKMAYVNSVMKGRERARGTGSSARYPSIGTWGETKEKQYLVFIYLKARSWLRMTTWVGGRPGTGRRKGRGVQQTTSQMDYSCGRTPPAQPLPQRDTQTRGRLGRRHAEEETPGDSGGFNTIVSLF